MPPFAPDVYAALDTVRSVGGLLGLRKVKVVVRKRVWTGARPGAPGSTSTDTLVELVNVLPSGLYGLGATATVTGGSKTVTFSSPVTIPDRARIGFGAYDRTTTPPYYVEGAVQGATSATLSLPYAGANASGLAATLDGLGVPVRTRQLTRREIISSGGLYRDGDLKVGPMTPAFAKTLFGPASGSDDATLNPTPTASATEVVWVVSAIGGTFGLPVNGLVFELKGEESTALHYNVILRSKGMAP